MTCRTILDDNGRVVCFLCGPRQPAKKFLCQTCFKKPSERQCDYQMGPGKTCDKHLCAGCAVRIGPDMDQCPDHPRQYPEAP